MKKSKASVDSIHGGVAHGSVASALLASEMNANALRTNGTLRKDEWKAMDETVVEISRKRLVGVSDLVSRGLVYNIDGLASTVLETENMSDMDAAQIDMDGATESKNDRLKFGIGYLPLPIIHRGFNINTRVLNASRNRGQSLDTLQAGVAAKKVAELTEEILFTGADSYKFGEGIVYGYTDFPQRKTVALASNWDASGKTGAQILADVLSMKQTSINAKHYGPWIVYVPTAYDTVLDADYSSAKGDISIRQRILETDGVEDIKVADSLTANNVVMVELTPETVRMVIGMQPTTIEWETKGGLVMNFKVMTIMVPQLRADQDNNCGIIHLSAAS